MPFTSRNPAHGRPRHQAKNDHRGLAYYFSDAGVWFGTYLQNLPAGVALALGILVGHWLGS